MVLILPLHADTGVGTSGRYSEDDASLRQQNEARHQDDYNGHLGYEYDRNDRGRDQSSKQEWDGSSSERYHSDRYRAGRREGSANRSGSSIDFGDAKLRSDRERTRSDYRPELRALSELKDTPVTGTDGKDIGHIDGIAIDPNAGRVAYAIIAPDELEDFGNEKYAVPFQLIRGSAKGERLVADVRQDEFEDAPELSRISQLNSRSFAERVHDSFNAKPYWEMTGLGQSGADEFRGSRDRQSRMEHRDRNDRNRDNRDRYREHRRENWEREPRWRDLRNPSEDQNYWQDRWDESEDLETGWNESDQDDYRYRYNRDDRLMDRIDRGQSDRDNRERDGRDRFRSRQQDDLLSASRDRERGDRNVDRHNRGRNDRQTRRTNQSTQPGRIVMIDNLRDKEIQNRDGQRLGDLEDLMVDLSNGHVAYAVVNPKERNKQTALPFDRLTIGEKSGDRMQVVANVSQEQLINAPSWRKGQQPDMASTRWNERMHQHYGATPYYVVYGYVISRGDGERSSREADRYQPQSEARGQSDDGRRRERQGFTRGSKEVFSGKVAKVREEAIGPGLDKPGVQIVLKSLSSQGDRDRDFNRLRVNVAPLSFLQRKDLEFERNDQIKVTGFLTRDSGKNTLVATRIEKDGDSIRLRDRDGNPRWKNGRSSRGQENESEWWNR
jgi:sporulation protein YlmC with PRC-barrel domain